MLVNYRLRAVSYSFWGIFVIIVEYSTVAVKFGIATKALFLCFGMFLSVMLDSLMFIYIHIISYDRLNPDLLYTIRF